MLRAAAAHQGTALVEIYQNCNIFNDDAFEPLKDPETRDDFTIRLEHGQPIRWGADGEHGVVRDHDAALQVVEVADVDDADLVVHDAHAGRPVARLRPVPARRRTRSRARRSASSATSSARSTTT